MKPLIEITTIPIQIEMKTTHAKLEYARGTVDMEIKRVDRTVIDAMKMLSIQLVDYLNKYFPDDVKYTLDKTDLLTFDQFSKIFYKQAPACSLLFNVDNRGYVAMCIDSIQK